MACLSRSKSWYLITSLTSATTNGTEVFAERGSFLKQGRLVELWSRRGFNNTDSPELGAEVLVFVYEICTDPTGSVCSEVVYWLESRASFVKMAKTPAQVLCVFDFTNKRRSISERNHRNDAKRYPAKRDAGGSVL